MAISFFSSDKPWWWGLERLGSIVASHDLSKPFKPFKPFKPLARFVSGWGKIYLLFSQSI
jgi:hypothetical protein